MFSYYHEIHDIGTRNHDSLHVFHTRLVLRRYIAEVFQEFTDGAMRNVRTHSIDSFASHVKPYWVDFLAMTVRYPTVPFV